MSILKKKLNIALKDFTFEKKGEGYFKIKVTDETCFKIITKESDANFTPKENVMYACRALLQLQSVFFKLKIKMIA